MSKKTLVITGRVVSTLTKDKSRVQLGAGTKITEVPLPDKTYGLADADVERIIRSRHGYIKSDAEQAETPAPAQDSGE